MIRTFAGRTIGATLTAVGSAVFIVSVPALATSGGGGPQLADPPGNGFIKIDDQPLDDIPNNQPHVGCTFRVDFYNFDEGVGDAYVEFLMHAPTQDVGLSVSGDTSPDIGEDPAGGGNDLDASVTYTLSFDGEPHPVQGYHVKVIVEAPGSQGADEKHKVFWVTGCDTPTTPTETTETTTTTPTETTETSTTTPTETTETTPTETTETTTTTPTETTETTTTTPTTTVPTTTVPSSTSPATSTVPTTTVPSSTLPSTSETTSPPTTQPETTVPTTALPSTSDSPTQPGSTTVPPTDFDAGLGGPAAGPGDSGVAGRSPWALAGMFAGLAMTGSGLTVLARRRVDDAA